MSPTPTLDDCVGQWDNVNLPLFCPPGFGIQNHPQEPGLGGIVTVVYQNSITPTEKPVWHQDGIVLGGLTSLLPNPLPV